MGEGGRAWWGTDDGLVDARVTVRTAGGHGQVVLLREDTVVLAVHGSPGWWEVLDGARGLPCGTERELVDRDTVLLAGQSNCIGEGVGQGRVEVRATVIDALCVVEEGRLRCGLDIGVADEPRGEGHGDEECGDGEGWEVGLSVGIEHVVPFARK